MAKKQKKTKNTSAKNESLNATLPKTASSASLKNKFPKSKSQLTVIQDIDPLETELMRKCLILQIKSKVQAVNYYRNWFKEQSVSIKILHQKAFISTKHYHQHLEKLGFDLFGHTSNELLRPSSSLSGLLKNQLKQLLGRKQQLTIDLHEAEEEWKRLKEITNPANIAALENSMKDLEAIIQNENEAYFEQVEILRAQHRANMEITEKVMMNKKKEAMHVKIQLKDINTLDTAILRTHNRLKKELDTVTKALSLHSDEVDQLEQQLQKLKEEGFEEPGPHLEILGAAQLLETRSIKDGGQRFYE